MPPGMKPAADGYRRGTDFRQGEVTMTSNERIFDCGVESVWSVLADGWLYPLFVVGATRMREVDDTWPAPGSELHHSVGVWPAVLDDSTEVLESTPPTYLRLKARAWPSGAAEVIFELEPLEDGRTRVVIHEDAIEGPARLLPKPVRHPLLLWRNKETLARLAMLAERRKHG